MYKKFTVAALLLLGCLVFFAFFARQPQAIASPILQQNTPTPAPEEEEATSGDLTHEETVTATVATEAAEPTLPDLMHYIKDLQAQIDALKTSDANANAVTTALYLLDTAGLHDLDVRLNEEKGIEAGDAGQVGRIARLLSSLSWPAALASDATTLIDLLTKLSSALTDDDLDAAAPLSTAIHEAQHEFSHAVEEWLADQPAAISDKTGQPFRVTSAVYLLDSVGLHELSERLSKDAEIQAADAGKVTRIARLLSTVDWTAILATDAISLTTTLNELATALTNDDLAAATPLADAAHEAQHDFSHAAEHWLGDALDSHDESAADDHTTVEKTGEEISASDTISDNEPISDTHSSGG